MNLPDAVPNEFNEARRFRYTSIDIKLVFFPSLIQGHLEPMRVTVEGFPTDAEYIGFDIRPLGRIVVVFEHPSFDEIEPGQLIPYHPVMVRNHGIPTSYR